MPVFVLDHPLAAHLITHLRDRTTKPATFRTLAYHLSLLLAIEATAGVETEDRTIETPLEPMTGRVLARQTRSTGWRRPSRKSSIRPWRTTNSISSSARVRARAP
jgi:uracil phosphoribosyltransferase